MMLPAILKSAEQKEEAPTAVSKTNTQSLRQLVESSAEDHCNNPELRLRGHANGPTHHVLRHAISAKHVPRMHQHRGSLIGTMMQESHDARIVEILVADVVANLYAKMTRTHASGQFL